MLALDDGLGEPGPWRTLAGCGGWCIQERPRPGAAATRPIAKPAASATAQNEGSCCTTLQSVFVYTGASTQPEGQCACIPLGAHAWPGAARESTPVNTPSATQKPHSSTPHTQHTHKLCVPLTRTHAVPLLGSGGASQSRARATGSPSQRGRLGERGVGGAAAAGKKCLKLITSFTTNTFYHPR